MRIESPGIFRTGKVLSVISCLVLLLFGLFAPVPPVSADNGDTEPPKTVRAVIISNFDPYYLIDESGNPQGFAIDVIEAVARRAGLTVTYTVRDSWAGVQAALISGSADIIPNMGITPDRQEKMLFSQPYETFDISLFIRSSTVGISENEDVRDRPIAVIETNAAIQLLKDDGYSNLVIFFHLQDAFLALLSGEVDALAYPEPPLLGLARDTGLNDTIKPIGTPLTEIKRGIAINKDRTDLLAIIEPVLAEYIGSDDYLNTYAKWFGEEPEFWTPLRILWLMGGLLIATAVGLAIWRYFSLGNMNRKLNAAVTNLATSEYKLNERVKEISCLHRIDVIGADETLSADEFCRRVVEILPQGWQYPENTAAKISLFGKEYTTDNFPAGGSPWKQAREIQIGHENAGSVEIVYLDERPESDEGPFLAEERTLIDSVAEQIARSMESKRYLHQLEESELRYSGIFNQALDGIVLIDAETGIIDNCNPEFQRQSGRSLDQLHRLHIWELLPPENQVRAKILFEDIKDRGRGASKELELQHPDGTLISVEFLSTVITINEKKFVQSITRDISDRLKTENELRDSQKRFISTLNSMIEGCQIIDFNWQYIYLNDAVITHSRSTREQLIGKTIMEVYPEIIETELYSYMKRCLEDRTPHRMENRFSYPDGEQRWFELSIEPIEEGIFILSIDITDRKDAETRLIEESSRRSTLMDQSRDGIVILDQNGYVYECNQRFADMLGYSLEETQKLHVHDWESHFSRDESIEMIRSVDESGDFFETRHKRKDGTLYDVEISTNAVSFVDEKLIFCVCRDITERKRSEEAIRYSEEHLRTLFETMSQGIVYQDRNGEITEANPAAETILGLSLDQMQGRTSIDPRWRSIKEDGSDFPGEKHPAMTALHEGKTVRDVVMGIFNPASNNYRWLLISSIPEFKDGESEPYQVISTFTDITERKRAEEERQKMEEQLIVTDRLASIGELSAGIAHEINNPLTGVIGFSELLLQNTSLPETVREDLEVINKEANRTADVARSLLTFARRHEAMREQIEINTIIENVLTLREYELKVNNITVVTDLSSDIPKIIGDGFRLLQVFLNIIINAEYFMKQAHNRGTLEIATRLVEDTIVITFKDDGPGIEPKDIDHLFDPFFTTKEVGKGTGLGLSICYGIVADHNGKIRVESKPDQGATFIIELPVSNDGEPAEKAE